MDDRTGKLYEFENESQKASKESELNRRLVELTSVEHQLLKDIAEEDRPRELALMRYVQERKALGSKVDPWAKQAFRHGYDAARRVK